MNIGNRIRELRRQRSMTQQELAEAIGCAKSTISMYEKNQREPGLETIGLLASVLGLPISRLMDEQPPHAPVPPAALSYTPMPRIPIVGSVRAGADGLAMEKPDGYELADVRNPVDHFYLRVAGDSMTPEISEGDLALVHIQPHVESGELAVAVIGSEEGSIKKVIHKPGALILQAFNPLYPPRLFTGSEITKVRIAGKVIRTMRSW